MKQFALYVAIALSLTGCSNRDVDGKEANSRIVHNQIGRFAIVPAQNGYPAMVLDTAAGCVMTVTKADDGTITMDEAAFIGGTSSCNAMKQLLTVDTFSRVVK
jgi:hypothetical protein